MPKTVIIADDHPFITSGIQSVISDYPDLKISGTAKNGIQAIALIKKLKPNCALLDLSMPGANGLEVFLEAKKWSPKTRFIILTGVSASAVFKRLFDAGIDGLLIKNAPPENIARDIMRIANGERVICDFAQAAINNANENDELTEREMEILHALVLGHSNREIAVNLGVSHKTIDSHRTNLLRKLKVKSTTALVVKALSLGLVSI